MTLTDKLKLELFVREQLERHGDDFYDEMIKILNKIENEKNQQDTDSRGRPNLIGLRG